MISNDVCSVGVLVFRSALRNSYFIWLVLEAHRILVLWFFMFLFSLDSRTLLSTIINPNSFCASPPLVCSALFSSSSSSSKANLPNHINLWRALCKEMKKKITTNHRTNTFFGRRNMRCAFFFARNSPDPIEMPASFIFFSKRRKNCSTFISFIYIKYNFSSWNL